MAAASGSANAELVVEALHAVLEAVPTLDERDVAYVAAQHPWATPEWIEGIHAMSRGQPSEDTKLIAQLMQQLQVQQLNIGMLEAERGNNAVAHGAADPSHARPQQQQPTPAQSSSYPPLVHASASSQMAIAPQRLSCPS